MTHHEITTKIQQHRAELTRQRGRLAELRRGVADARAMCARLEGAVLALEELTTAADAETNGAAPPEDPPA